MYITNHATKRMKQRGFPGDLVELIMEFGTPQKAIGNATKYQFGKKEKSRAIKQLKYWIQILDKGPKAVIVDEDEGSVITAYNLIK